MSDGINPTFPSNASPAGGTDNPGGADVAGHGVETETGHPTHDLLAIKDQGSDNAGGTGHVDTSADPSGGVTREGDGSIRESGESETAGALGSVSGQSPSHFPGA